VEKKRKIWFKKEPYCSKNYQKDNTKW